MPDTMFNQIFETKVVMQNHNELPLFSVHLLFQRTEEEPNQQPFGGTLARRAHDGRRHLVHATFLNLLIGQMVIFWRVHHPSFGIDAK
jgi:hypothetical protein